jgi:hypothetical protein
MKPLLLDRRGEVEAPPGYVVIAHEADWLRAVHKLDEEAEPALLVRGAALCDWAEAWWRGRGWPCEERRSPLLALRALCPNWSEDEARAVWDELRANWDELEQPLRAAPVLQRLYPAPAAALSWDAPPSLEHAAAYLLWLENAEISSHHAPLLSAQAAAWDVGAGMAQGLYAATGEEAHALLRAWLEAWPENTEDAKLLARRFAGRERWGVFPLPVPPRWERLLRHSAAAQLARDGLDAWHTARRAALHQTARQQWAEATLDWLQAHPAAVTPVVAESLSPHLPPFEATRLRRLAPPPDPGDPFENARPQPSAVLEWAAARYTPWRLWQVEHGDAGARTRALQLAAAFGEWFLRFYSDAQFGAHAGVLSVSRARELRGEETSRVTLWIIADGLGWSDAQTLWQYIERRSPLLHYHSNEVAFAALPTITHFAKPALRYGVMPAQALQPSDEVLLNTIRREIAVQGHRDVTRALSEAQAGDLILWTPLEPDKTYHETADIALTRAAVDGALGSLAEMIAEAARAAPAELTLEVLIATDHGRLLGESVRTHAVPAGFSSHGRAAYSTPAPPEAPAFDEIGVAHLPDAIVLLDPERFGLRETVAIALDNGSFRDNAGRGGGENFPHGGIFPEEVVVPWLRLQRGSGAIPIEASGSGRTRRGETGVLRLEIVNPSASRLHLVGVELQLGARDERTLATDALLPPFDTVSLDLDLASWPSGAAARAATGRLLLRQADGREYSTPLRLQLESEELQTRDEDILGDLLL